MLPYNLRLKEKFFWPGCVAHGILVLQPGIDLASPEVEVLDHKGSPQNLQIWIKAIKGQTKTYSIRRLVPTEGRGDGGCVCLSVC